jgi:hypothetical protein
MKVKRIWGAVLLGAALSASASARKPAVADEAAVRTMIERLYAPYTKSIPELPDDGNALPDNDPGAGMDGYELPYTQSLDALVTTWSGLMRETEELYGLNSFDWYCQCQDNDAATSRLVKQSYAVAGKDRITANILFSPGQYEGKATGEPLIFQFRREDGVWKLDDLKFGDKSTLRKGLASDIKDATKDLKAAK